MSCAFHTLVTNLLAFLSSFSSPFPSSTLIIFPCHFSLSLLLPITYVFFLSSFIYTLLTSTPFIPSSPHRFSSTFYSLPISPILTIFPSSRSPTPSRLPSTPPLPLHPTPQSRSSSLHMPSQCLPFPRSAQVKRPRLATGAPSGKVGLGRYLYRHKERRDVTELNGTDRCGIVTDGTRMEGNG